MDNTSSIAPSADFGIMYVPSKWLRFGVSVADLLQPDVSLSGAGSDDENIEPMKIRAGLGFTFGILRPALEIEYIMRDLNDEAQMKIHGGIEAALSKSFAIRGGYDRSEAALGFGYTHFGEKINWNLDYAAQYPLNELSHNHLTSHHITWGIMIQPPPVPLEDMELVGGIVEVYPKQLVVGNPVTIKAKVANKSEIPQKKVNITCYYQDDQGKWNLCSPFIRERFELGEEKDIIFSWTPPADGHYTIYVSVDDDGTKIPAQRSRIEEYDEANNTGSGECWVYRTPEGIISPRDNRLKVSKLNLFQEEEPIIPVLFFAKTQAHSNPVLTGCSVLLHSVLPSVPMLSLL